MSEDRNEVGIKLCEEILNELEHGKTGLSSILRKTLRFTKLLNKEEDFRWVETQISKLSLSGRKFRIAVPVEIVENIENNLHKRMTQEWLELKFGGVIETIFEDTKKLVDSKLIEICPDAIDKFTTAYDRIKETNPESWAQAVTTCRRILKDFADTVYPPKETLVEGRKVGEEEYINRLWAFASENIESDTNKELIQSEINYMGGRIDSLYHLANKGTHSDISKDEAEMAIIRTYFLIGDLIKLGSL